MTSIKDWNRPLAVLAGLAIVASVSVSDAFWGSHGSYGSRGSRGSFGSAGSYGSTGSFGSYGGRYAVSYASTGSTGSYGSTGSHGSYGSTGSHGSTGGYASAGSHGSHGHVGPLRRLAARIHAKRAARASNGSYGSTGSHGSYGSAGSHGSTGSYGSTGGYSSVGSHGGYSSITAATPTLVAKTETGSGQLIVSVPAAAKVFVNDRATTSTGSSRNYVSNGLAVGKTYKYRVRVEYELDGEPVVETKVATLTGGGQASLEFGQAVEAVAKKAVETKLTLSVPADAKVTLSGAATQQTGQEREYTTTQLADGSSWDNYVVSVTVGEETQDRVITLRGGESQHLVFDFATEDSQLMASIN